MSLQFRPPAPAEQNNEASQPQALAEGQPGDGDLVMRDPYPRRSCREKRPSTERASGEPTSRATVR